MHKADANILASASLCPPSASLPKKFQDFSDPENVTEIFQDFPGSVGMVFLVTATNVSGKQGPRPQTLAASKVHMSVTCRVAGCNKPVNPQSPSRYLIAQV